MTVTPLAPPAGSVKLTGAIIGTVGSYKNQGNTIPKAMDGSASTYFDAPSGTIGWVGLDLGLPQSITQVQYLPRSNYASRMVGGVFQGSSTADFSSDVTTLATITAVPVGNAFGAQSITSATPFRYVRYLAPANGSGNVAELEFDGKPTPVAPPYVPNSVSAVAVGPTDVKLSWHYDGKENPESYTVIRWQPTDSASVVLGKTDEHTTTFEDLTALPGTAYSYSVIANQISASGDDEDDEEPLATLVEAVVTTPTNSISPAKLTGTVIGTAGSYRNQGKTIANVFDGDANTFFDAPTSSGAWVGLDFGSQQQITQIKYMPRSGFAYRMTGGVFQASNSADFSTGVVTLLTIKQAPAAKGFTSQSITAASAFRYVRYLSPANGCCNVAELEFDGVPANVVPTLPAMPTAITWSNGAVSPIVRAEAVGATVNGKVYVFGGFSNDGDDLDFIPLQPRCDCYDPASNSWTRLTDFPEPFTHSQGVVVGTQIWFAGGYVGDHPGPGTTHVWMYDTLSDTWTRGPDLPVARGGGATALVGNTLYFVGGMDASRTIDEANTYALDLTNLSAGWTERASVPNGRNHVAAASIGGYLYVLGGQHGQEDYQAAQTEVDRYDPFTNTWQTVASLPAIAGKSHTTSGTFVYDGHIIIVGGETGYNDPVRSIMEYNPVTNAWNQLALLPAARSTVVAGIVNGQLIVTTGNSPSATNTTWIGTLNFAT